MCLKLCRICDKKEVTKIIFGPEDEEDARFILLPDCNHIVVVEMLDQWMSTDNSDPTGESQEITSKYAQCARRSCYTRVCLMKSLQKPSKLANPILD